MPIPPTTKTVRTMTARKLSQTIPALRARTVQRLYKTRAWVCPATTLGRDMLSLIEQDPIKGSDTIKVSGDFPYSRVCARYVPYFWAAIVCVRSFARSLAPSLPSRASEEARLGGKMKRPRQQWSISDRTIISRDKMRCQELVVGAWKLQNVARTTSQFSIKSPPSLYDVTSKTIQAPLFKRKRKKTDALISNFYHLWHDFHGSPHEQV